MKTVLKVSNNKEFKCHKNSLNARSKVFKNMLVKDHAFIESTSNTIRLKDVYDEAVEDMIDGLEVENFISVFITINRLLLWFIIEHYKNKFSFK